MWMCVCCVPSSVSNCRVVHKSKRHTCSSSCSLKLLLAARFPKGKVHPLRHSSTHSHSFLSSFALLFLFCLQIHIRILHQTEPNRTKVLAGGSGELGRKRRIKDQMFIYRSVAGIPASWLWSHCSSSPFIRNSLSLSFFFPLILRIGNRLLVFVS